MAISDRTRDVLRDGIADKAAMEELVDTIDAFASGVVPPDSINNNELAVDVKVGSLATLTTTDKSSVTAAINELDAGKPDAVSPSVVGNLVSFADITGGQADSGFASADLVVAADIPNTFTGDAYGVEEINITHDATPEVVGTEVFVIIDEGSTQEGILASENANGMTAYFQTDSNGYTVPVIWRPIGEHEVNVTDADGAAGAGVVMYAHWTGDGQKAVLKFVSPTSAMGSFDCNNGGDTVPVIDSDTAADGGVAIYFDEDAATTTGEFLIASPTGQDLYIETTSGRWIKLTHVADPTVDGVLVYFDEDAGNAFERLLFVSPTDTSNVQANDSAEAWQAVKGQFVISVHINDSAPDGLRLCHFMPAGFAIPVAAIGAVNDVPRLLNIAYDPGAGALPELYFDDDAASIEERLFAVAPLAASFTNILDPYFTLFGQVASGVLSHV